MTLCTFFIVYFSRMADLRLKDTKKIMHINLNPLHKHSNQFFVFYSIYIYTTAPTHPQEVVLS